MDRRNLGSEGLVVSSLGLGCMGMSEFYGTADEGESIATAAAPAAYSRVISNYLSRRVRSSMRQATRCGRALRRALIRHDPRRRSPRPCWRSARNSRSAHLPPRRGR